MTRPVKLLRHTWVQRFAPASAIWLCLAALLAAGACRETPEWDPDVAALVDGRPIALAVLDRVLDWGLYPQLSPGEAEASATVRRRVLDKLIEERLVLLEAGKRGLSVSSEEIEQAAARLEPWLGQAPPPEQAEALRLSLRNQIISHKMTEIIMREDRNLSAAGWRVFWGNGPRPRPARYRVRALFLPPGPEDPDLPARTRGDLDQLAEKFKLDGLPVVVSTPVWLRDDHLEPGLAEVLETAWARRRTSDPVKLTDSWAVYEVLAVDRRTDAALEMKAARAAYELRAGEEAFRRWLDNRRAAADIRINPILADVAGE